MENIIRPEALVLSEQALIPEQNLIVPPPNQFTHELAQPQPYYYTSARQGVTPDGELAEGTQLVLLVYHGGNSCRVTDGQGLYVELEYAALRKL